MSSHEQQPVVRAPGVTPGPQTFRDPPKQNAEKLRRTSLHGAKIVRKKKGEKEKKKKEKRKKESRETDIVVRPPGAWLDEIG